VNDKGTGTIQAIETHYKGYHFRSRIEARWAVFYDCIGIEWEYEKEGYTLPSGRKYLPDFYIPHLDCWIEIKGTTPAVGEDEKAFALADITKKNCYIFYGQIPMPGLFGMEPNYDSATAAFPGYGGDNQYWWCVCPVCGRFGIEFNGRGARVCRSKCCPDSDKEYTFNDILILNAYKAARSARFGT
jgi:hypothetical protein